MKKKEYNFTTDWEKQHTSTEYDNEERKFSLRWNIWYLYIYNNFQMGSTWNDHSLKKIYLIKREVIKTRE